LDYTITTNNGVHKNMKKVLVTGTCGFIFSNFVRTIKNVDYEFVGVDKLIEEHNLKNVDPKYKLHIGDIADVHFMDRVFAIEKPDIVIHGAAESFVDNSIKKALPFIHSNVLGTQIVVDMCMKFHVEKLMYVSTDEVYGQLESQHDKSWTEKDPINPRNPYSASKAAGELIVKAANQTHGLNYIITRCCNNFGPRQPPRNLVPKIITSVLARQNIPIHGSGEQIREWLYVNDHCNAIMFLINNGKVNEIYNIGSGNECTNVEMVTNICYLIGYSGDLIKHVADRPGHDFRYSIDNSKILELGWKPSYTFEKGLEECVNWYLDDAKH